MDTCHWQSSQWTSNISQMAPESATNGNAARTVPTEKNPKPSTIKPKPGSSRLWSRIPLDAAYLARHKQTTSKRPVTIHQPFFAPDCRPTSGVRPCTISATFALTVAHASLDDTRRHTHCSMPTPAIVEMMPLRLHDKCVFSKLSLRPHLAATFASEDVDDVDAAKEFVVATGAGFGLLVLVLVPVLVLNRLRFQPTPRLEPPRRPLVTQVDFEVDRAPATACTSTRTECWWR